MQETHEHRQRAHSYTKWAGCDDVVTKTHTHTQLGTGGGGGTEEKEEWEEDGKRG